MNQRKTIIVSFLVFIILFSFYLKYYFTKPNTPINIILISIDTLRADHMGVYGYHKNTTPNIDNFARNATVYTSAYTTFPVTSHSFYTLFSGNNGVFTREKLRYNIPTKADEQLNIYKVLKENDYKSNAFVTNQVIGKWYSIFRNSFDDFNYFDLSNKIEPRSRYPYISKEIFNDPFLYERENSQLVTKNGIKWLKNNEEYPFFLWLHYTTPHWPYTPSDEYICKIDQQCNLKKYHSVLSNMWDFQKNRGMQKDHSFKQNILTKDLQIMKVLYDAEIRSVDDQVKLVIDEIYRLGLDRNSIIIILSDHGESFDHDVYFDHGLTLYNSNTHIPLIIYFPLRGNPRLNNQLIDNSDLLPYLLDIIGIEYDKDEITGQSLINDNRDKMVYSLTSANNSNKFSVFDGAYKYIYSNSAKHFYRGINEELYNLKYDPEESNNLISSHKAKAQELKNLLFPKIQNPILEENNNSEVNQEILEKLKSIGY